MYSHLRSWSGVLQKLETFYNILREKYSATKFNSMSIITTRMKVLSNQIKISLELFKLAWLGLDYLLSCPHSNPLSHAGLASFATYLALERMGSDCVQHHTSSSCIQQMLTGDYRNPLLNRAWPGCQEHGGGGWESRRTEQLHPHYSLKNLGITTTL